MDKMWQKLRKYLLRQFEIDDISKAKQTEIFNRIQKQYQDRKINFSSKIKFRSVVSLGKKRRIVVLQDVYSLEYLLLKYFTTQISEIRQNGLQQMQAPTLKLLEFLDNLQMACEFTIVRFDFKNYYNNLSAEYIYKKFIGNYKLGANERFFLERFVEQVPYCFAGLTTSNFFAEIIDSALSQSLQTAFSKVAPSVCFHYGDDFNLIIYKTLCKDEALSIINRCIRELFHSPDIFVKHKNKEAIHTSGNKFSFLTSQKMPISFNFLGYEYRLFEKDGKIDYCYGIVEQTKTKFMDNFVTQLKNHKNDMRALKTLTLLHCIKVVYPKYTINNQKKYISTRFNEQVKCLRFRPNKLNKNTIDFLKNAIVDCFAKAGICGVCFLKENSKYNLYHNIMKNNCLFFDEQQGVSYKKLVKMVSNIALEIDDDYNKMAQKLIEHSKIKY